MSHLTFGTFANAIKNATSMSNVAIVDMLVDGLAENASMSIDPSDKNKLFNCKKDFAYLREAAMKNSVQSSIYQYFEDNVIGNLSNIKINLLIELLKGLINGEKNITNQDKESLISIANKENLTNFLSKTFLIAASQNNDTKNNSLPQIISGDTITIQNGKIFLNGKEVPLPDKLTPPKEFDKSEAIYITELLKAYADKQKVSSYTMDTLPTKYQNDLKRHRQDYYNAEAMHRKIREIYNNNVNEFEVLKDDTFNGVIDTALMEYNDGYERLLNVLSQAVKLEQGKSLMWQLPLWLGSSEKKGICHILVNDKKLSWVVEDEENI